MTTTTIARPVPHATYVRRGQCLGKRNPDCTATHHGTQAAYASGCRCPHATNDHRIYQKRHREGRAIPRRVDATGTKRRIHALWALGHTSAVIGAEAGITEKHVCRIAVYPETVSYSTWHAIHRAFRVLSTVPGTSDRTRARAKRAGYAPPLAWDDIDDPNATPDLGNTDDQLIDQVAIEKALAGKPVRLTETEKNHAVQVGVQRGMTLNAIAQALHISYNSAKEINKSVKATA